ncbi:MAG: response regulator [Gammaproteobacteria bacterium]|nr:response regulator [Gammaproteobacteria bacterium]MDH5274969.1 response regulator [Gammaproteobacteria bacterium]
MTRATNVLIADDDPTMRLLLSANLVRLGLQVVEAANGREAIEYFDAHRPGIVLLDACMPELDGIGVCRYIRRTSEGATVPIIMITSLSDSDSVKAAMGAGATDYITKPVNWGNLKQRLSAYLE